jgi:hypothetical protein
MAGPALKSSRPTHVPASSTTSPNFEHRHRKRQAFYKKVEEPVLPVECAQRPHRAAAERRLPALPGAVGLHPDLHDGYFRHRQNGGPPRAHPGKNPALRGRVEDHDRALCRHQLVMASEVAPAHRSRRCAGRPARGRLAIPMPAFGRIGDGHTLREHRRQVLRHIMTSFGLATGFFRSMCRHKRPARWIGRPSAQDRSQSNRNRQATAR